jgi:hypothetical protein
MPVTVSTPVSALTALQDLYITFQSKFADVSNGQFKIPVSWEDLNSSAKIILPERAFVSNFFGDKRDIGVPVRLPANCKEGMAALDKAFGGTLCIRSRRVPADFGDVLKAFQAADSGVRLLIYIDGLLAESERSGCRSRTWQADRWSRSARSETHGTLLTIVRNLRPTQRS